MYITANVIVTQLKFIFCGNSLLRALLLNWGLFTSGMISGASNSKEKHIF